MSQKGFDEFIAAINESEDLQEQAFAALDGSSDPGAFCELGRRNNFELTQEEVVGQFSELVTLREGDTDTSELSEEQLSEVAGGRFLFARRAFIKSIGLKNVPKWSGGRRWNWADSELGCW